MYEVGVWHPSFTHSHTEWMVWATNTHNCVQNWHSFYCETQEFRSESAIWSVAFSVIFIQAINMKNRGRGICCLGGKELGRRKWYERYVIRYLKNAYLRNVWLPPLKCTFPCDLYNKQRSSTMDAHLQRRVQILASNHKLEKSCSCYSSTHVCFMKQQMTCSLFKQPFHRQWGRAELGQAW